MSTWDTIFANVVSGAAVALVVAVLAWLVTDRIAAGRERANAARERDLAAAAEFYRVYGDFFAVWKAWELHSRSRTHQVCADDARRTEVLTTAAAAEGGFEAVLVRIAIEHDLTVEQEATLWSVRFGFKELRRAVRKNTAMLWWRSDEHPGPEGRLGFEKYETFKFLAAQVAALLTQERPRRKRSLLALLVRIRSAISRATFRGSRHGIDSASRNRQSVASRRTEALLRVTGTGKIYKERFRPQIERDCLEFEAVWTLSGDAAPDWLSIGRELARSSRQANALGTS